MNHFTSICVFCGASTGKRPVYLEAAEALGLELARQELALVYGGGTVGLMGVLAQTVHQAGGQVTGVLPEALAPKELSGEKIGELHVVDTMHTRKATMARLSDAFIAMPGGYGTLEELFEVVTWAQLGYHRKPLGLLNVAGYFDPLIQMVDHAIEEGFVRASHRSLLVADVNPASLIEKLRYHEVPPSFLDGLKLEET